MSDLVWYTLAYSVAPKSYPTSSANTWAITMCWLVDAHLMPSLHSFTRNTQRLAVLLIRTSAQDRSSILSRSTLRGFSGSVIKSLTWFRSRSFSSRHSLCPSTFLATASSLDWECLCSLLFQTLSLVDSCEKSRKRWWKVKMVEWSAPQKPSIILRWSSCTHGKRTSYSASTGAEHATLLPFDGVGLQWHCSSFSSTSSQACSLLLHFPPTLL